MSANKDKTSVFKVKSVNVKVDSLKFSIRDSKHDFLYKTLKPLATVLVKKQIQKAIQDGVRTGLEYLDGQLVGVRDRMDAAQATQGQDGVESKSRMQVLQEVPPFHPSKYDRSLITLTDVPEEEGRDRLFCEREVPP